MRRPHPVRVAIDGPDAAGKTTLADELAAVLRERGREVIRASVDAFHRPAPERHRRGAESPAGYYEDSFDYPALRHVLLEPLGPGGSLEYRTGVFDHRADAPRPAELRSAPAGAVLLFDGVFLLRPELRDHWDLGVFVAVSAAETLRRARVRDAEAFGSAAEVERRYRARYLPGQELYLAEADPLAQADLVVRNDDASAPRLERR